MSGEVARNRERSACRPQGSARDGRKQRDLFARRGSLRRKETRCRYRESILTTPDRGECKSSLRRDPTSASGGRPLVKVIGDSGITPGIKTSELLRGNVQNIRSRNTAVSTASGWSTMAMTRRWRSTLWRAAAQIWSRSDASSISNPDRVRRLRESAAQSADGSRNGPLRSQRLYRLSHLEQSCAAREVSEMAPA
jgi:hypothetical protein